MGGEKLFAGTPSASLESTNSVTAPYLARELPQGFRDGPVPESLKMCIFVHNVEMVII